MGLLSSAPEGVEVDNTGLDDADGTETESQHLPAEAAVEPVKAVPLPDRPISRREAARREREAMETKVRGLEESVTKMTEENRRLLSEQQQQLARIMGNFEAMQRTPQQQARSSESDAASLMKEATEHLEAGRFDRYQEKMLEAAELRAITKLKAEMPQQQQAAPNVDPRLQAVMMTTPAAGKVMSHERGMQLARVKDQELAIMGYADGPERWKRAFELAEQSLFGGQQKAQFATSGREALAGVPTGRTNGSTRNGAPQVKPPPGWEQWASRADMTKDEYLRIYAESHPEAVSDD